jgi:hypothetical protein
VRPGGWFLIQASSSYLEVVARLDRATQYSEAVVFKPIGRGVLDAPLSRGMTRRK